MMGWGPLLFVLFCCHGFFERHVWFVPLNIFACFCNISFVFMHFYAFVRSCVAVAFVACVGTVRGAWYWYACHASHHHHVFIIMFIMFIIMMIIDHHDVHRLLFVDQSLNDDCCSLIVRWLCEREQCESRQCGWCPSLLGVCCCGMAVACAVAGPPQSVVSAVSRPSQCGTRRYCGRVMYCVLPGVWCVGGECVSVLFVWWGILCLLPPHCGGGWGHCGWWVAL
jgi:hypothetical protein